VSRGDPGAQPPAPAFRSLDEAAAWFDGWLRDSALPLWWIKGADHFAGGFHEGLTLDGEALEAPRRARVQARQTYVYATAGTFGWAGPWAEAARHGMDFLTAGYRRKDGLFMRAVTPQGAALDPTPLLYEQAFVLLAMAAMHAVAPGAGDWPRQAADLRAAVGSLRHGDGGFRENDQQPFQANAQMHLLEAALAWEGEGEPGWGDLADELAELCLSRFIDADLGLLREAFDGAWRPAAGEAGRVVEPGHQFEWAWLLERWGRRRGRPDARAAARRLFSAGCRGVDPARGLVINSLWDDLSVRDAATRLWPQTERLKAALILGEMAEAVSAAQGLAHFLAAPTAGLWHERGRADGRFVEEPAPASSFYHIVCACRELSLAAG
jgi:mannose-6-phosphate isomerase